MPHGVRMFFEARDPVDGGGPITVDLSTWMLVMHYLEYVALVATLIGSVWLLCASRRLPRHLFNRQLWHLALADIGLSCVDPIFEGVGMLWRIAGKSEMPDYATRFFRSAFHFFLIVVCIIEVQVAACVTACTLRSLGVTRFLEIVLPWVWPMALVIGGIDAVYEGVFTEVVKDQWTDVAGCAPVVAICISICFACSVVLYATAVVAVVRATSPSSVVKQASTRALVFPSVFLISAAPAWLMYTTKFVDSHTWFIHVSLVCLYSNGWLNAATYGFQHGRRLCKRQGPAVDATAPRAARLSFHVAFGDASCVSAPPSSPSLLLSSSVTPDDLWAPFISSPVTTTFASSTVALVEDSSTQTPEATLFVATIRSDESELA